MDFHTSLIVAEMGRRARAHGFASLAEAFQANRDAELREQKFT